MIKSKQCTQKFKCEFTNGLQKAYVDVNKEKGGQKEGFRPHELLEASLANCLNIVIRMEAEKLGVEMDNVQTRVELDRSKENNTIFNYEINFDNNLPQEKEEKLLKAVENCPVKQTLRNEIEFSKNL